MNIFLEIIEFSTFGMYSKRKNCSFFIKVVKERLRPKRVVRFFYIGFGKVKSFKEFLFCSKPAKLWMIDNFDRKYNCSGVKGPFNLN